MIGSPVKAGIVAAMGLVLLVSQGCSMKWLQSDGETGAGAGKRCSGKGSEVSLRILQKSVWGRAAISYRLPLLG